METHLGTWNRTIRSLHFGLAIGVSLQLLLSLVMEMPISGIRPSNTGILFFKAHVAVGLTTLVVVVLHWVWLFSNRSSHLKTLFPWNRRGIGQVFKDLGAISRRQLLEGGPNAGGLVGLVHGLGLLTVTGMVVTGAGYLITTLQDFPKSAQYLVEIHKMTGILMWAYVIGHGAMALIHQIAGHGTLRDIFTLKA